MRKIKSVWNLICAINSQQVRKIVSFIVGGIVLLGMMSAGFMSCSPNFNADSVSSSNSDRDDDDDDDDDRDDGEECRGHDTCEKICEKIYDSGRDQVACQEEGINKVGRLDEIYELLEEGDSRDFDKIYPDEDGVELDDFQEYLEVGISGLEHLITDSDGWNSPTQRKDFLSWITNRKDVAEVLNELDDNDGHQILEDLLLALSADSSKCISDETLNCTIASSTNNRVHYTLGSTGLKMCINAVTANANTVNLANSRDADLYDALSCTHTFDDGGPYNVFAYASEEDNRDIFDMAYDLLNNVCEEERNNNEENKKVCRKAFACWTGSTLQGSTQNGFFDFIEDHRNDIERNSGDDGAKPDYDDCDPTDFAPYFP